MKVIFCDGASNPSNSGVGAVWFETKQLKEYTDGKTLIKGEKPIHVLSKKIEHTTNNVAEYKSLIEALKFSIEHSMKNVIIFMDSKLVVNQVQNKWNINYPHLQKLKDQVDQLKNQIKFSIKHIRREYNTHADKASKDCINDEKSKYFDSWSFSKVV